ncbi:MAG: hypothetical protein D8H94_00865 [Cardiobacterium sp.]|jgi:hypothetical protein|nr:MAG: hypothetical protein D8H94_00865 [Cardiobacterium sp.]
MRDGQEKPGLRRVVVEKIRDTAPQKSSFPCEQALPEQRVRCQKAKESMFFVFFLLLMPFVSQHNHDGKSQGQQGKDSCFRIR